MVFTTTQELKNSGLYARSDTLKAMSLRQLNRFLEIYNVVHARVSSNGGDMTQAEGTAIAIAVSAARRSSASLERELEPEVHYFAAMSPQQIGRDVASGKLEGRVFDFQWIAENPDIASLAVAGNEFNFNHDQSSTSLGRISGLVLRENAPLHVQEKTHPDIPFLFAASYYADVDTELKNLETISAEWSALGENDGAEIPLPLSFAVTRVPLNGPENGVKRIASWILESDSEIKMFAASLAHTNRENFKSDGPRFNQSRGTMPTEAEVKALQAKVASLTEQLETTNGLNEKFASLSKTVEGFKGLEPLREAFASLKDSKSQDPNDALKALEAGLGKLNGEWTTLQKTVAQQEASLKALMDATLQKEATEFAASLVTEGKIKADTAEKWAGLFKKDKESATDLAAGLEASFLGSSNGNSRNDHKMESSEADLLLESIDPLLRKKKEA